MITSDHPVLLFKKNKKMPLFLILPISPIYLLIAYDKRYCKMQSLLANEEDIEFINIYIAGQSLLAIYSNDIINESDQNLYREVFKKFRKPFRGYTSDNEISIEYIEYKDNFSFIETKI